LEGLLWLVIQNIPAHGQNMIVRFNISSKVLDAYRAEGLSLDDVRSDYGLASNCGQCLATAERLMASAGVPMPAQRAIAESQLIAVSA